MFKHNAFHLKHHPIDEKKSLKDLLLVSLKGFCMGIADVIPGVSGGTIAFILGIYEDLIQSIRSFNLDFLKLLLKGQIALAFSKTAWRFLGSLLLGIGCAIILFSKIVTWLLAHHPVLLNAFFFGLILASVPIIARAIKQWSFVKLFVFFISTFLTFFFVCMTPVTTPEAGWFIILSGALAICAMILPGISGAFILLLLGKYEFILNAIHQRDFVVIFLFSCGMFVGIISFVRILEYLFKRYHDLTMALLTGFVLGSLNKIWPWKEATQWLRTSSGKIIPVREINSIPNVDAHLLLAISLIGAGFLVAYLLHVLPQKFRKQTFKIQEKGS